MMQIVSVVTEQDSWFNEFVPQLIESVREAGYNAEVIYDVERIPEGEVAFFLSLEQIVPQRIRARNRHNIVVHASALPKGKGWSPVTWQILEGEEEIPITLFEAVDAVDAGPVYLRSTFHVDKTDVLNEIRTKQAKATMDLCVSFIGQYPEVINHGENQRADGETFYPRRSADDSEVSLDNKLSEIFNLIRVSDPDRYPAFFEHLGYRWELSMKRAAPTSSEDN